MIVNTTINIKAGGFREGVASALYGSNPFGASCFGYGYPNMMPCPMFNAQALGFGVGLGMGNLLTGLAKGAAPFFKWAGQGIAKGASWLWNNAIAPAGKWIGNNVANGASWLWDKTKSGCSALANGTKNLCKKIFKKN